MKINFEQLKTLVEAGDEKAFSNHIFGALEKGDLLAGKPLKNSFPVYIPID